MCEQLLREAEEEGVEVISLPLHGNIKGLYCDSVIALNKNIPTTDERTCVLAEELGHYHTSHGNIIDISKTANKKQEIRARRWAVKRLVTLENIIKAYKVGCRNLHEMAEYIGVTEDFLQHSFKVYNNIYGKYKEYGWYVIFFDPPRVYKNICV